MKFNFFQKSRAKKPPVVGNIAYTPHPLPLGASLGEYNIEKVLTITQSGYTYAVNSGMAIVQEYFPHSIAIRDADGKSVLLRDSNASNSYENGLSQFLLLARILSQIDHPGRVIHYQEEHDTAWYAIDFQPRASLGDFFRASKRISEESLQVILGSALVYLEAAHQHEIFHLELSPEQLIFSSDEELILCGFNVARILDPDLKEKEAACYFPPEHSHTAGRLGPWSDFYGLGAMLYQSINLRIPPTATRRQDALQEGRSDPLVPAAKLGRSWYSSELLEMIDWLLEISTGDRPNSVQKILRELDYEDQLIELSEDNTSISFGPSYKSEYPTASIPSPDTNIFPNEHAEQYDHGSPLKPLNLNITRTTPSAAKLAVTGLSGSSNRDFPPIDVTDALIQAAIILEPSQTSRKWSQHQGSDSQLLSTNTLLPAKNSLSKSEKTDNWPNLLRLIHFYSTTRKNLHLSKQRNDKLKSLNGNLESSQANKSLFKNTWARTPIFWLCLAALMTAAGIWILLNTQSTPLVQPTRIEFLSIKEHPSIINTRDTLVSTDWRLPTVTKSTMSQEMSDSLDILTQRAKRYVAEGAWFGSSGNNAYATYQEVLGMEPSNELAVNGLNDLVSLSLAQISADLKRLQLDAVYPLISALKQRELAMDQMPQFEKQIQLLENQLDKEALAKSANAERLQSRVVIRREKINDLLNRASNAFENGRFIEPPGRNALTLYRAALDLDRNNQRARNGINSISDRFLQQARMAFSKGNLDQTEQSLHRATIANKQDPMIRILKDQLERRQGLLQKEKKIQAELESKQAEVKRVALQQEKINLSSGIGAYYRGNYFEAYSFLQPLAERGFTRAQVRVAAMLLEGRGIPPSKALARKWFVKALSSVQLAASRGEAWAQSDYGDYFTDGIVIRQNFRQAVIWYRRSAYQGYSPAQANLGLMHMHGSGVSPDWNEAIEWFRMAAAQGNYAARENLRLLEVKPSNSGS